MKKILIIFALTTLFAACTPVEYDHFSTITGTIVDYTTGEPLDRVLLSVNPGGMNTYSSSDGLFQFKFDAIENQYTFQAQKDGYKTNRKYIHPIAGETIHLTVAMEKEGL